MVGTAKWNRGPSSTRAKNRGYMSGPGNKPAKTERVGLLGSSWPGPGASVRFQPGPKPGNPEPLLTLPVTLQVYLYIPSITASIVYRQGHSITSSICISKLNIYSLNVHLWVHSNLASKWITTFTWFWPPCKSLSPIHYILQVYCLVYKIVASKYITESTGSQAQSISLTSNNLGLYVPLSSLDLSLQVHCNIHYIISSKFKSKFSQWASRGAPLIPLKVYLQPVQTHQVLMNCFIQS